MLVKEINLSKSEIKEMIDKYKKDYNENMSRKNILMRAIARCSNQSDETLI